jgi:hypothetical protein
MLKYGTLFLGFVLLVSACGGSESSDTTTTTTAIETSTTTSTRADTNTTGAGGGGAAEPIVPGENGDADEIANVYAVVFDSNTTFAEKAPYIDDSVGLESTAVAFGVAGTGVGGIFLEPTAVAIDGDGAVVIYDLQFGGEVFQADQVGEAVRNDGVWQVTHEYFCSVMALARVSCS